VVDYFNTTNTESKKPVEISVVLVVMDKQGSNTTHSQGYIKFMSNTMDGGKSASRKQAAATYST